MVPYSVGGGSMVGPKPGGVELDSNIGYAINCTAMYVYLYNNLHVHNGLRA